jgi:hypothetical protein
MLEIIFLSHNYLIMLIMWQSQPTRGGARGGRGGAHAPPQPPKIFLTHGRKSSRCPFCPPSTAKSGTIETQSSNFRGKLQLRGRLDLEIFLNFTFRLEPDENGEEDDENDNAP